MTRYRIAVCDDEPSELEDIVQSIKRYDAHGDIILLNLPGALPILLCSRFSLTAYSRKKIYLHDGSIYILRF